MRQVIQNKETLVSQLLAHGSEIRSFGVSKLSIFGSFAKNRPGNDSDVDFLVEFDAGKKNYDNFMELSFYLEDLLDREVELVTPESLSRHIGPHILKQAENVAI